MPNPNSQWPHGIAIKPTFWKTAPLLDPHLSLPNSTLWSQTLSKVQNSAVQRFEKAAVTPSWNDHLIWFLLPKIILNSTNHNKSHLSHCTKKGALLFGVSKFGHELSNAGRTQAVWTASSSWQTSFSSGSFVACIKQCNFTTGWHDPNDHAKINEYCKYHSNNQLCSIDYIQDFPGRVAPYHLTGLGWTEPALHNSGWDGKEIAQYDPYL